MMRIVPLLTTTEPGFMGSVGPLLPHQLKEKGETEVKHEPRGIYFHGQLERWLGYDIPVLLAGKIDFSQKREFHVQVLHPDPTLLPGNERPLVDAVLAEHSNGQWYITVPQEVKRA